MRYDIVAVGRISTAMVITEPFDKFRTPLPLKNDQILTERKVSHIFTSVYLCINVEIHKIQQKFPNR